MKNALIENRPLTPENLVESIMQRLAAQNGPAEQTELALQAAVELATDLLRIRQEHDLMLQHAQQNLERLQALAHRRADLLHLTERYLKRHEAFPGEKRLRDLVRTAESSETEPFHHN